MVQRLAIGGDSVMAAATTAYHLRVIDPPDRIPGGLQVTVLAQVSGDDVIGRNRGCPDQAGTRMTGAAFAWRAAKHRTDMTALAIDIAVGAIERITGRQMVEVGAKGRLRRGRTDTQKDRHDQDSARGDVRCHLHQLILSTDRKSVVV